MKTPIVILVVILFVMFGLGIVTTTLCGDPELAQLSPSEMSDQGAMIVRIAQPVMK